MTAEALPHIQVAAIALLRGRRVLMVTARGRDVIYMPGGKIDAGESAAEAHGEPDGRLISMRVFLAQTDAEPAASAEVDAIHWADSRDLHRCPPAGAEVVRQLLELGLID